MKRSRLLLAALSVSAVAAAGVLLAAAPASAADLLTNPGFEAGSLSGWSCSGGTGSVVRGPVHSGSFALSGAATTSDNAQCTQTVSVQPGTAYTLSAWVLGSYVYLGVTGGASNWTPSAMAAAIYVVQVLLRMRAEEADGPLEPVFATAVSRRRWAAGHAVTAPVGATILVLLFAAGAGVTAGGALGDPAGGGAHAGRCRPGAAARDPGWSAPSWSRLLVCCPALPARCRGRT
jgi:hypothetical protein